MKAESDYLQEQLQMKTKEVNATESKLLDTVSCFGKVQPLNYQLPICIYEGNETSRLARQLPIKD